MTWRVAKSLIQLREQVNKLYPERSKVSDGTIGNAAHAARTSDHNPWVHDDGTGIVTGMDISHDPIHGLDSEHLAECLRTSRDPRLKYVISNRKIAAFDHGDFMWRAYSGANAHNHHCHISVKPDKAHYDGVTDWDLSHIVPVSAAPDNKPHAPVKSILKMGATGPEVEELERRLGVSVNGKFDSALDALVKKFQHDHGLHADGIVGPYTWEKL